MLFKLATSPTSSPKHLFYKTIVHVLLPVLLGLLVYSNTFYAPFNYDDFKDIRDNPIINNFSLFMEPSSLKDFSKPEEYNHFKTRFITLLTFAVNYRLNGLDVTGYHLVNLGIHIINALLVYLLATFTLKVTYCAGTGEIGPASGVLQQPGLVALFTALLFVCHPIQTEAVTYIIQRLTSLAAMFYLLSIVLYIKWRLCIIENPLRRTKARIFYVTTLTVTCCAMLTKENTFTLPITIALYEFIFFQGDLKKRVLFLTPVLLTMLIIPLALTAGNQDIEKVSRFFTTMSRQDYLFTQFRVIVTYLRLLVLPFNQNIDYDYPIYRSFFEPEVLLSFAFLLSLCTLGVYLLIRSRDNRGLRPIAFGIFWFFLTLSVESSIIPIADVIVEHRVYLPSVGFFMALTSTWGLLRTRWGNRAGYAGKALLYAMVLVVMTLSTATYARNDIWREEVRLWEDVVRKSPNKTRPHFNLGRAYQKQRRFEEAIVEYRTVVQSHSAYSVYALNYIGVSLAEQGRIDEAISEYTAALKMVNYVTDIHYNLASAYLAQGRIDEAISEYQAAVKLNPDSDEIHFYLGAAYKQQGRFEEAINEYHVVLRLNPGDAMTHNNLGNAYGKLGRMEEAINEYGSALKLKPDFSEAHYNLGNAYGKLGRMEEAINEYGAALKLKPDFIEARRQIENYSKRIK